MLEEKLETRVAIVTGGARGIGREIAINLAKKGIKVIVNYNKSEEKAKELKEKLAKQNIEIDIFKADVSKLEDRIINTNLYSAFAMCREVVPNMIQRKTGCIINISSVWGLVGSSLEVIYSISKAGMDGLTKSLAKELGPSNIRVNSIAPGIIDTSINNHLSSKELEDIKQEIPLEKIGKPQDIAKCVEWLIDDNYTTGQVISINGGWVI